MARKHSKRSVLAVAALLTAITIGPAFPAAVAKPGPPSSGEVSDAEDNPEGCVTATLADQAQCGAQGRDHFASPAHVPPIEACDDIAGPTGSQIVRVKPDGPRHEDGSLAFIPGACVYLPPGYAESGLRYPVVYLLHGGGGDQADWVTFGNVQGVLDGLYAQDPANAVIAVMPDGHNGQWYDTPDPSWLVQTYVRRHLVPWIDGHLRTIADRRARAITGLSNGGYGSLHLAGRAPDLFVAAGSMSGNLGAYDFQGLYTEMAPGVKGAATYFQGSLPANLIPNMDHVDLTIDWGATCTSDAAVDACGTWAFEQTFRPENQNFRDQLEAQNYQGTYEYRETEGAHAWRWWTPWLRDRHMPFFLARLADPEPAKQPLVRSSLPASFRYRSVADRFAVWGYEVSIDRPAREFLELRDVTAAGLTVIGSGQPTITTAARYTPGRRYLVRGTGGLDAVARADKAGRLRFAVDLGPAHTEEQYYTVSGTVGTTTGNYFTERAVTITPR
jgi:S-formylglutathione hydrolase FrmB